MRVSRRDFCVTGGLGAGGLLLSRNVWASAQPSGWASVPAILARIVPPTFPNRDFDITKFGAKTDEVTNATAAIRAAIAACAAAGGGRVVVPAGPFVTGAIRLESRVNLYLAEGAVLRFSQEPRDFLPMVLTRFEGVELFNYSPFIYALDARDIAITGRGTLDGRADADHWWAWKSQTADRTRLLQLAEQGVPVAERRFGDGHFLRPNFIQPYRCTNVLIEGVTIVNSPMWEIHPVLSTNVTVRGVTIVSHGPNNDGCDPESCRDVLIEGCTFDTGDDCIAIKSGRNADGRRVNVPVENVIVRDCVMKDGHGGVTIGSEITGGARNIFAERCRMDSPRLDRVLRFKNNAMRGGTIEHVYMRDVTVGEVAESIVNADFYYEEGETGGFTPVLRDVEVRAVTSTKSKYALYLRGFARAPIADVRIADCTFDGVAQPEVLESVRDLTLSNVRINGQMRNERISR
ncbi:MAG TPA: glycoside hydrolase family 28 protein [Vicinamibacterales bacterium]|nr:glycoside hydrolase family 28 protein [Vicinamibacterales bacterium]